MRKKLAYLLLGLSLSNCIGDSDLIRFETSQPDNVRNEVKFPRKFQGKYSNKNQHILITSNLICSSTLLKFSTHRSELKPDSALNLDIENNNQIISELNKEGYEVKIIKDSIFVSKLIEDTIFQISQSNVLKKYKGYLYLNKLKDEGYWTVRRSKLKKDTLFFEKLDSFEINSESEFVHSKVEVLINDSVTVTKLNLNPSKKQFRKWMKSKPFSMDEYYIKVK